jgi:hypothetical protein
MNRNEIIKYMGLLLNTYREEHKNQYPCSHNDCCCGICDRYYPCLFDLIRIIKKQVIEDLRDRLKVEGLNDK